MTFRASKLGFLAGCALLWAPLSACDDDPVVVAADGEGEGEGGPNEGEGEGEPGEGEGEGPDRPEPPDCDELEADYCAQVPTPNNICCVPAECHEVEYTVDGETKTADCRDLDRCPGNAEPFAKVFACCSCAPRVCNNPPKPDECPECRVNAECAARGEGYTCTDSACAAPPVECVDEAACRPGYTCNVAEGECVKEPGETCMACHNGSQANDYGGNGLNNPHPFPPADQLKCSDCHGGIAVGGAGKLGSHVPPPPSIGTKEFQYQECQQGNLADCKSFFNRRTLAGIDKLTPDPYTNPATGDREWSNLEYLQFINPGDLRVVNVNKGCGAQNCHGAEHGKWVPRSALAAAQGIFSSTRFSTGIQNANPDYRGSDKSADTLADRAPRLVTNPDANPVGEVVGEVGILAEQPEHAGYQPDPEDFLKIKDNAATYDANQLPNYVYQVGVNTNDPLKQNRVKENSPLEVLIDEQVNITCGDCHLYSAGANNRYADFRSSGCTACHMVYSYDGRSRSADVNVDKGEPLNPDAIAPGERSHVFLHQIQNVAKVLPNGAFLGGITDRACVGCHQGSNRTVLQYWGIRLDENQDLANNFQYPANPANFDDATGDTRLYDPSAANVTFNGRAAAQHIVFEDYDGDTLDDTPSDIHYEMGMGCIDCHGSRDLHNGTRGPDNKGGWIPSRQDQQVKIQCESCHGTIEEYTGTKTCRPYPIVAMPPGAVEADCAYDTEGNPLRHLIKDVQGTFWLYSRVTGQRHFVPQTHDVVAQITQKRHPRTQQAIYNPKASYAMGRADGNDQQTGYGPQQADIDVTERRFSHTDSMDCTSCHATWVNNCIGCHLATAYDANDPTLFSNITGERIVLKQEVADFVYQSPVPLYLGVNSRGKITQISPAEKTFYRYFDQNGNESDVMVFSDRLGDGNNPDYGGRNAFPALSQNQMSAHSIRGKIDLQNKNEGPRYCVACHLNQAMVADADNWAAYQDFFADYGVDGDINAIDFANQQEHIGQNTGNQNNSPYFVHMAAGLGTGLFLFDANGCPVNPLDDNDDRENCNGTSPQDQFDLNNTAYDLDKLVQIGGVPNASNAHPVLDPRLIPQIARLRQGAGNVEVAGPLGGTLLQKLAHPDDGLILDAWIDADGAPQGNAINNYGLIAQ